MKFFQDRYGDQYPVSRIHRIVALQRLRDGESPHAVRYQTVYLDDERKVEVASADISEITSAPAYVIPAAPGTYMLGGVFSDYETPDDVWKSPVLAWGIGSDGDIKPWTVDGENDFLSHPGPILHPCGKVDEPHSTSYRNIGDWFSEEIKRAQERDAKGEEL
jgi:hypothetical protein